MRLILLSSTKQKKCFGLPQSSHWNVVIMLLSIQLRLIIIWLPFIKDSVRNFVIVSTITKRLDHQVSMAEEEDASQIFGEHKQISKKNLVTQILERIAIILLFAEMVLLPWNCIAWKAHENWDFVAGFGAILVKIRYHSQWVETMQQKPCKLRQHILDFQFPWIKRYFKSQ